MSRSRKFVVPPFTTAIALGVAALFAGAAPVVADDTSPTATVSVWGATGAGRVDTHTSTRPEAPQASGSVNVVHTQAIGCFAHADGYVLASGTDPDVGLSTSSESNTCYQLDAANCGNAEVTWTASGTMNWDGHADVETMFDADASSSGTALLAYSGDLQLVRAAAVAAGSTVSGGKEVSWQVSLKPSYSQKYTRKQQATSDSTSGGDHCENSGTGGSVRVNVLAYAQADLAVDVNAFGLGLGKAELGISNVGHIALTITVTEAPADGGPNAGGAEGGGPSTPDDGSPPAPGGTWPGGVETPRRKVLKVGIDDGNLPHSPDGNVPLSPEIPEPPKKVSDAGPMTGTDPGGVEWGGSVPTDK